MVQESTAMLREWGRMLRDIYVRRDTKIFQSVQQFSDIISEQIGIRASLICGKLPQEEVCAAWVCCDCVVILSYNAGEGPEEQAH